MSFGRKDRGNVIFAVRAGPTGWLVFAWVMLLSWVGFACFQLLQHRRTDLLLNFLLLVLPLLVYVMHPRLRVFEAGIELPPDRDRKVVYLRWDQIERYSWDANRLIVTGTNSVLKGGPVEGGAVRVPEAARGRIDQLLAARVPVTAPGTQ